MISDLVVYQCGSFEVLELSSKGEFVSMCPVILTLSFNPIVCYVFEMCFLKVWAIHLLICPVAFLRRSSIFGIAQRVFKNIGPWIQEVQLSYCAMGLTRFLQREAILVIRTTIVISPYPNGNASYGCF